MDDMISKQQAVNALYEWEFDNKDDRDAIDVINGLPPIQPEPHWIPVTEQPPESREKRSDMRRLRRYLPWTSDALRLLLPGFLR